MAGDPSNITNNTADQPIESQILENTLCIFQAMDSDTSALRLNGTEEGRVEPERMAHKLILELPLCLRVRVRPILAWFEESGYLEHAELAPKFTEVYAGHNDTEFAREPLACIKKGSFGCKG